MSKAQSAAPSTPSSFDDDICAMAEEEFYNGKVKLD